MAIKQFQKINKNNKDLTLTKGDKMENKKKASMLGEKFLKRLEIIAMLTEKKQNINQEKQKQNYLVKNR